MGGFPPKAPKDGGAAAPPKPLAILNILIYINILILLIVLLKILIITLLIIINFYIKYLIINN